MRGRNRLKKVEQGYYKHYKGGMYQVIGTAEHSETLEELVIYRSVSGELWARPLSMWNEEVNGVPRFEYIKDKRWGRMQFLIHQKVYFDKKKEENAK